MKGFLKIKAGALQFVLFIGAIIAIVLLAFILISYTHSFFNKKTNLTTEVIQQADFGLKYSFKSHIPDGGSMTFNALDNANIGITVRKEYWGIFEKRTSEVKHNKIQFTKTAFVGNGYPSGISALYLKDNERPLILAGKAKITGEAILPKQGVRMGNIAGNSYNRDQLVYGDTKISNAQLPLLNEELTKNLDNYIDNDLQSIGEHVALKPNMELKNSFGNQVLFVQDQEVILKDVLLVGNIIIKASEKITVEPSAFLKDIVLIAPEIFIKNGVDGTFQAITTRSLHVGKNCSLAYPTALVVKENPKNVGIANEDSEPKLFVDANTTVKGMVLYLDDSEEPSYFPQVKISKNATVYGEIYCTKNLELKGRVNGNVTTAGFIAMENGSIYQNHLYNGKINSSYLSEEYAGLLLGEEHPKKVMKWLY